MCVCVCMLYIYYIYIACKIFLIEHGFPSMKISNIAKIADYILTHKYFEFNDESYIQTH